MSKKNMSSRKLSELFAQDYANKFNHGVRISRFPKSAGRAESDTLFLCFLETYTKSDLKKIISSSFFNKRPVGYWKDKKTLERVSVLQDSYKMLNKDCSVNFKKGWFLELTKDQMMTYKCSLIENIRESISFIALKIPSFKTFVLKHGSDLIKKDLITKLINIYGVKDITQRTWNRMFDQATTMDFKVFCMQYIPKKKVISFLKSRYNSRKEIPWTVSHDITHKRILNAEELTAIFLSDENVTPNKNSELLNVIYHNLSNMNQKNARSKLNWLLNKMEEINDYENNIDITKGATPWRLSRMIQSCISLISKEDLVFFIGHEYLDQYQEIISLKLSATKWS